MAAAIVDIDGTLTTSGDTPNEAVIARLRQLVDADELDVRIVSGRLVSRLDDTQRWLREHDVPYTALYLNDFAETAGPNVVHAFKAYKYDDLKSELGDALQFVVDNSEDARGIATALGLAAYSPDGFLQAFPETHMDDFIQPRAIKRAAIACDYKAIDDGPVGRFSGYGAVFGNVDAYQERILPGAFTQTLAEATRHGRMPAMLWQHNPTQPIGVWRTMREDARGLYVEGELADTQLAREAYSLMKLGALSGLSIGFSVTDERINKDDSVRELLAVNLWEVSPVTFPANGAARVEAVKFSGPTMTVREFEAFLRDAGGFSARHAKAIAARGFKALRDEAPEDDSEQDWMTAIAARLSA